MKESGSKQPKHLIQVAQESDSQQPKNLIPSSQRIWFKAAKEFDSKQSKNLVQVAQESDSKQPKNLIPSSQRIWFQAAKEFDSKQPKNLIQVAQESGSQKICFRFSHLYSFTVLGLAYNQCPAQVSGRDQSPWAQRQIYSNNTCQLMFVRMGRTRTRPIKYRPTQYTLWKRTWQCPQAGHPLRVSSDFTRK